MTILFSDRGTPYGYRHINGYGSHTFKWVNAAGEVHLVKYHFKTDQGIKTNTAAEADAQTAKNPDHSQCDLFDNIKEGNFPSWTLYVQLMPEKDAANYRFDVLDITKVWPHADYPLHKVGKMTLNRNPANYHAEVEQSAFSPSHFVPGIETSNDKMLQGRLFSYPDTQRYRLGGNYKQIPINCPYRTTVVNGHRDGAACVNGNQGDSINHEPNYNAPPYVQPQYANAKFAVSGEAGRYAIPHPNSHYEQPGNLYRMFNEAQKESITSNLAGAMGPCRDDIKKAMVEHFTKCDADYGGRIKAKLGL